MTPTTAAVDFESEPVLTPAGHRLLDAASALFYARGIRAVGVDLIAEEAGTTKKTLYDCFGSKDALVALYLRRRAMRWQEFLRSRLGDLGRADAVDRVRRGLRRPRGVARVRCAGLRLRQRVRRGRERQRPGGRR